MTMQIILGVDGSESGLRAAEWCARYAAKVDAHVTVVHAVELPIAGPIMGLYVTPPYLTEEQRTAAHDLVERDYCKPLADAGVAFDIELPEGGPASRIMDAARHHEADLVVVGRRGRGGFAELLLGSTSHELAHHLGRPLVIVP